MEEREGGREGGSGRGKKLINIGQEEGILLRTNDRITGNSEVIKFRENIQIQ
jgi:hypothetical protein